MAWGGHVYFWSPQAWDQYPHLGATTPTPPEQVQGNQNYYYKLESLTAFRKYGRLYARLV